jgi:hypothetical protein
MATIKIAATAASDIHENTLKLAPARLLAFLQGVAEPAIGAQLAPCGWSDERSEEAWSLLNELRSTGVPTTLADPVLEATAACEAFQATGLVRARAMLQLTHPEQAMFLFHDFVPGRGPEAVLNVAMFLTRRRELERGVDRKASRAADHEALAIIEQSGTSKERLKELEGMVAVVQSAAPREPAPRAAETQRLDTLRKIHAWITAWSEMARTAVTRRDQLIRLGLAKRRVGRGKRAVAPKVAVPVSPVSPVAPPVLATKVAEAEEEQGPSSRAA